MTEGRVTQELQVQLQLSSVYPSPSDSEDSDDPEARIIRPGVAFSSGEGTRPLEDDVDACLGVVVIATFALFEVEGFWGSPAIYLGMPKSNIRAGLAGPDRT